MTHQNWTLPLKGHPTHLIDVPEPKKRRTQKDLGVQNLQNQITKLKSENSLLKDNQKELIRDLLNMEIERDILKEDAKSLYMKKQQVSSLLCILEILLDSIDKYSSKMFKKRIKIIIQQQCPNMALETLRALFSSSPTQDSVILSLLS